jgi:hypothetical protein
MVQGVEGQGEQWDFPGHAKKAQPQNFTKAIIRTLISVPSNCYNLVTRFEAIAEYLIIFDH